MPEPSINLTADDVARVPSDELSAVGHDQLSAVSDEDLEARIVGLASEIFAAECQFLLLLEEFDRRGHWGVGVLSAAHWLNWRCGIDLGAARERVRVARSLPALPRITEAFARGAVSYSKVRAMTRVATADNEEELLRLAQSGTAAHLERIVRGYKLCDDAEASRERDGDVDDEGVPERWRPRVSRRYRDDGCAELTIVAPVDQIELIARAMRAVIDLEDRPSGAEGSSREPDDKTELHCAPPVDGAREDGSLVDVTPDRLADTEKTTARGGDDVAAETPASKGAVTIAPLTVVRPYAEREAEALVQLAESFLASPRLASRNAGERYQVVVHVDVDELRRGLADDPEARCADELGEPLPRETARRLACDCSMRTVVEGHRGELLDVGRLMRGLPRALRRALRARDRGCRFPGCTNTRWLDAHHIIYWAEGGPTALHNLVLLCPRHHTAVHEGGLTIELVEGGRAVVVRRPDGSLIPHAPALPGARTGLAVARGDGPLDPGALDGWGGERCDYDTAIASLLRRSSVGAVA